MDQQLLFLINHTWAHPSLDRVMAAVSSFDLWWPLLIVLVVVVAVRGGFRARMFLLAAGISVGITDGLVVDTLKSVVGRPRPHEAVEGVRTLDLGPAKPRFLALNQTLKQEYSVARIKPPHGNSFPSGHASNNFTVAVVCAVFYRRWGWLAFLPAALVAYSRIYVGSHWPLDVLVSCFLGSGIGLLTCASLDAIWRRWGTHLAPKVWSRHPEVLRA